MRIGRIAYRIGLYSLHLRHFVWRARTGDGGRGNHRRIHDQFSRYFARRGTEAFLRHEIRFVERNRLHIVLFTGLYGGFAMQISDWIARNAPILGTINPAQQVTNLFYDILYYDSYQPFITTCAILLAMSAVFLLAGIAMLRRQRYEHL